ncbi:MAG TPA: MFS transporter [Devosiaceae bacterium]|jgi:MFS family permease|nr:MFS transporter [Devosiaceae bacterium]
MSIQASVPASPVRNIALLSVGQALGGASQALLISVAALTAALMAPDPSLATLPVTLMIIGTALATGPAAWLIHTWGRRRGFVFGASVSIPSALLAAAGAYLGNFWLFCAALAVFGSSAAFAQQYRFAAADSVPPDLKSRAISWVMFGGVLAGFIGPQLATLSRDIIPGSTFTGTYIALAGLGVVLIGVLSLTRLPPTVRSPEARKAGRSFAVLLRTPDVLVPMAGAAVSYALMVLVMVAAPLAMVYVCGHTSEEAAFAIQWHIVAMFAPSFVTGAIVARIGAHLTAALGLLLILCAAIVNLNGISVAHFVASLVLLGVGWNFGFIACTSLLSTAYRPEEAARVQGLNEQVVFGSMAVASIASGLLLELIGWEAINILAIPLATAAILLLGWGDLRKRRRQAPA